MNRRLVAFVVLAGAFAVGFVRLGFWQLDRLAERRAFNRERAARFAHPASPIRDVVARGESTIRAVVDGVADYDHEFVLRGRSHNGSPGVHVFTPVRLAGSDTAVLVNRGWVYAPDAATIDLSRWREPTRVFHGYTVAIPDSGASIVKDRSVRALALPAVQRLIPYPIHALYVVAMDSSGRNGPVRLSAPAFDDGPHLSYAVQWFCFAAIAVVGAAIVYRRARHK